MLSAADMCRILEHKNRENLDSATAAALAHLTISSSAGGAPPSQINAFGENCASHPNFYYIHYLECKCSNSGMQCRSRVSSISCSSSHVHACVCVCVCVCAFAPCPDNRRMDEWVTRDRLLFPEEIEQWQATHPQPMDDDSKDIQDGEDCV